MPVASGVSERDESLRGVVMARGVGDVRAREPAALDWDVTEDVEDAEREWAPVFDTSVFTDGLGPFCDKRAPRVGRVVGELDRMAGLGTGEGELARAAAAAAPGVIVLEEVGDPDDPPRVRMVGLAALIDVPGRLD